MSEELKPERDALDGGFAVVDRERIIAEETREITPWYRHFINVFIAPQKMMEENFYQEAPKGLSVGIVGSIVFGILTILVTYLNPAVKEMLFDNLRQTGIAEEMLQSKYIMTQVVSILSVVIMVFIMAAFTAGVLKLVTLIAKDKAKFGVLFIMLLLRQMVVAAIGCIEAIARALLGVTTSVFGLGIAFDTAYLQEHLPLTPVISFLSLTGLINFIFLIIGYKVVTNTTYKKSIIVVTIFQLLAIGIQIGVLMLSQSFTNQMMGY